jgi:hypothetical protein
MKAYNLKLGMTEEEVLSVLEHPDCDNAEVFRDSDVDLDKAVFLYYLNSGLNLGDYQREFDDAWEGKDVDVDRLCRQIDDEVLSDVECDRIVREYFGRHSYTDACLFSCAACGYRMREQKTDPIIKYRRVVISDDIMSVLEYSEIDLALLRVEQEEQRANPVGIPYDDRFSIRYVEPWKVKSVFISTCGRVYHLHPELVDTDESGNESCLVCPRCYDSMKDRVVPSMSIAGGVDFGYYKRLGLELPNLHEEVIIAKTRLIVSSLKIKSNMCGRVSLDRDVLQCNAILFVHDNIDSLARMLSGEEMFNEEGLVCLLRIFLLDDKGGLDRLARVAFSRSDLFARPWVVCQWIYVLVRVHVEYIGSVFPCMQVMAQRIRSSNERIRKQAVQIDTHSAVEADARVGSDVAHVQSDEMRGFGSIGTDTPVDGVVDHTAMRVTCVLPSSTRVFEQYEVRNYACLTAIERFVNGGADNDDIGNSFSTEVADYEEDFPATGDASEDTDDDVSSGSIDIDEAIRQGGSLFGDDEDSDCDTVHRSGIPRHADPINEFTERESIVVASFPTVFMLGKSYGTSFGKLSDRRRDHLLHQFTMMPSKSRRLMLYLYDAVMRFRAIVGVNAHLHNCEFAVEAIRNLRDNKEERALLAKAIQHPDTRAASEYLAKYIRHFEFSGLNVPYGCFEGKKLKALVCEMCKRYRPPSAFLTFNFDDINNARAIRASYVTYSNTRFPSVFEDGCPFGADGFEFIERMKSYGDDGGDSHIDLSEGFRASLAKDDPLTFVSEIRETLVHVCEILLGIRLEGMASKNVAYTSRKTVYYKSKKGIFGHALAAIGVIEDHAKGTVHFHLLLYGGLSPYVLQKFASFDKVCESVTRCLDSMYSSCAPEKYHVGPTVRRIVEDWKGLKVRLPHFSNEVLLDRPDCSSVLNEVGTVALSRIVQQCHRQMAKQQHHRHMRTCKKGRIGLTGCRLCLPFACKHITGPVLLVQLTQGEIDELFNEDCDNDSCDEREEMNDSNAGVTGSVGASNSVGHYDSNDTMNIDVVADGMNEANDSEVGSYSGESDGEFSDDEANILINNAMANMHELPSVNRREGGLSESLFPNVEGPASIGDVSEIDFSQFAAGVDYVRDGVEIYVCTRDEDGRPKIAFKVMPVLPDMADAIYARNDILSMPSKQPLVVWETARPMFDCQLSNADETVAVDDLILRLRACFSVSEELSHCNEFWDDIENLKEEELRLLYKIIREKLCIANGYVSTYNPVLSFCTGSHNNCVLLGGDQQAKGAVFYVCPYMTKEKTTLLHTATLMQNALRYVDHHESVSPDRGQPTRDAKQLLHRIMNQMNLNLELSDYQIAAALLGIPSILRTDTYAYCNPETHIGYRTRIQMHRDHHRRRERMLDIINDRLDEQEDLSDMSLFIDGEDDIPQENVPGTDLPARKVYSVSDLRRDVGYLEKFTVDRGTDKRRNIFLPKSSLYANRGKGLRYLNLMEYYALIKHAPKAGTANTRSARFEFSPDVECAADYDQMLLSKQRTVIVLRKPPRHPGKQPLPSRKKAFQDWTSKAAMYARYYLTLYRPEIDCYASSRRNHYDYSWESLKSFIAELRSDLTFVSKLRLASMFCRMKGFYTPYVSKLILSRYRGRNRDEWDNQTIKQMNRERTFRYDCEEAYNDQIPEYNLTDEHKMFDEVTNNNINKILDDTDKLVNAFKSACPSRVRRKRSSQPFVYPDVLCGRNSGDIQAFGRFIHTADVEPTTPSMFQSFKNFRMHVKKVRDHRTWVRKLKPKQREIYELYRNFIRNPVMENAPPLITWVNGAAGTGKSELIRRILVYTELKQQPTLRTAFNSINALQIGGQTTWSILHFRARDTSTLNSLEPKEFSEFKELLQGVILILIDEFSNQAPWHLAKFSTECQRATGNFDLPFGGIPVIMGGDLQQMGPVKAGKSLAEGILDMCLNVWAPDT